MAVAEKRIAAERSKALTGVRTAAAEAAAVIVERLIGVSVSAEDAAKAVPPIEAKGADMELLRDPEFWVGIGTLIFLGIVLWKRVPALVASSLDARAAAIAKELEEARRLRAEAEALLAEYQEKRAAADQEASSIVAEAKAEAERFGAESRAAITAQIARRGKQAEQKIAQAEAQAVADVRAARRRCRDRSGGKADCRAAG